MKQLINRILSLALAGAMALSLAACGSSSDSSAAKPTEVPGVSETTAEAEAVAPETGSVKKESLNIGVTVLWATLSPFQTTQNQNGAFTRPLYDRLAVIYDGEYVPQMAESWEVADDGLTWTVKIHDNITDSQGNHITADDLVWFTQESMNRKLKPLFNKLGEVSKIDDTTIQFVMKSNVVGAFEMILASVYGVSEAAFKASDDEFANTTVSSSAYKVVEFVPGSHLSLELREDYWDKDNEHPALQNNVKHLTYTIITEASQQQIALETGTVDCFESLTSSLVPEFDNNPAYGRATASSGNGIQMYFSGDESRPCGRSEDLCKAIAYCIDVNGVVAAAYEGLASTMHCGASKMLVGYNPKWDNEPYFEYNVDKAKDYLASSGYDGEELVLVAVAGGGNDRLAQILQGYMTAIGINCKLSMLDAALFSATRFDGAQYDMILVSAGGITITNWWGVRFDMNAYEKGDGTARRDETLTNMIYNTWTVQGYTEENIDAIHYYLMDHCYVYGLVNPDVCNVYRTDTGLVSVPITCQGPADFAAAVYQ